MSQLQTLIIRASIPAPILIDDWIVNCPYSVQAVRSYGDMIDCHLCVSVYFESPVFNVFRYGTHGIDHANNDSSVWDAIRSGVAGAAGVFLRGCAATMPALRAHRESKGFDFGYMYHSVLLVKNIPLGVGCCLGSAASRDA